MSMTMKVIMMKKEKKTTMNKEEIKLKLESISANSHYLRVSESHPL